MPLDRLTGGLRLPRLATSGLKGPTVEPPTVSGTTAIGDVLTAMLGSYSGTATLTHAWAWQRDGVDIAGTSGTGTTLSTYTVAAADAVPNAGDTRKALRFRHTVTDGDGYSTTKWSAPLDGPALGTDDTASVSATAASAITGNALANDETGGATITAAAVGAQSLTLGVATNLDVGGIMTVNSDGSWSFDPDGDFGAVPITQTETVPVSLTRSDGGTETLTITVNGEAEVAYSADPADITTQANPETWPWGGGLTITLDETGGEFPAAVGGALGVRRALLNGTATWVYTYTESPSLALAAFFIAGFCDDTSGSGTFVEALSSTLAGLTVDFTGGNARATLTDEGSYSQTVQVALPSTGMFVLGVTINTDAGVLGISITTSSSTAATAVTASLTGYTPPTLDTLRYGEWAGAHHFGQMISPAKVTASALQTRLAGSSWAGTYHQAAPTISDPGGLTAAHASTGVTLDLSGAASGGTAPLALSVSDPTGAVTAVSIAGTTATISTATLGADGSGGFTVRVTDARGLWAEATVSVSVTVFQPSDLSGLVHHYDFSDTGSITSSGGAVSSVADQVVSGGLAIAATGSAQPTTGATINSLNVLTFDGATDYLASATNATGDNSSCTMFAVVQIDSGVTSTGQVISIDDGISRGPKIRADSDRALFRVFDTSLSNATADTGEGGATLTAVSILIGTSNGTTAAIIVDGSRATAAMSGTFSTVNTPIAVGALSSAANFLKGKIGEVGHVSRALSDSEINQLGNYLANKWGGTWTDL